MTPIPAMWMPGGWELIVILAVGLLLFGGRLPEVGKSVGRSLIEFRKGLRGIKDEVGLGELEDIKRDFENATGPVLDDVYDSSSYVDTEFEETEADDAGAPAPDETAGEPPEAETADGETAKSTGDAEAPGESAERPALGDTPEVGGSDAGKPPAFGYRR